VENLHLKLDSLNGNEIIFREGSALPPVEPEKIAIVGDINTVATFIKKRKGASMAGAFQTINPDTAMVTVDKQNLSIELALNPSDPYSAVVTGKLSLAPELEKFCINTTKMFNREELIKLIRFNKIWFDNADAHDTLLKAYQAFSAEVNAKIGKESDMRGNVTNNYQKTVNTNVPTEFVLNVPIFKGMERRRFRVEIAIDSTDASTRFWFESVDLAEVIQIESEKILSAQLESCADYVVIWK
jgi:hypothetical protein